MIIKAINFFQAREVQVVFPNIPQSVIMEDLRVTRSVDLTIDNILEGRVAIPAVRFVFLQYFLFTYSVLEHSITNLKA